MLRRCFWSDPFPTSIEEEVSFRSPEKKITFFLFCIPWKMWHCYAPINVNPVGGGGGGGECGHGGGI